MILGRLAGPHEPGERHPPRGGPSLFRRDGAGMTVSKTKTQQKRRTPFSWREVRQKVKSLTLAEYAADRRARRGIGPSYARIGGKIRYRETDIQEWVESRIRRTNNAVEIERRDVALPLLAGRSRVHGQHRLGRHRTQQERRGEGGSEGAGARNERAGARAKAPGQTVQ